MALGVAWMLGGLEVTPVGSVGGVLERLDTLGLTAAQIGASGSLYIGGAVLGALLFRRMADRLGRKKLFLVTLRWGVDAERRALEDIAPPMGASGPTRSG